MAIIAFFKINQNYQCSDSFMKVNSIPYHIIDLKKISLPIISFIPMQSRKRTELYEMGEFKLIELLTENVKIANSSSLKGVGDDAAIIKYESGKATVVTTDLLLEGIHFDLVYTPLKHLGYKAVIVNISDVYAMNAIPKQITVSIGVSAKFCLEDLEELYSGIYMACNRYGVDLVGGDTSASVTGLTISITAIGEVEEGKTTFRNGARVTDLICVSGNLGAAYLGLQLLEREKRVLKGATEGKPKFEGYSYLLERFLKPEARKEVVEKLAEQSLVPTSMIDVSDGLSSELLHICKNSGVGCRVYIDKLPIDQETQKLCDEMSIDSIIAALSGGEDYELLFTIPLAAHSILEKMESISVIGHIVEEHKGTFLVTPEGGEIEIEAQGWNSLKKD